MNLSGHAVHPDCVGVEGTMVCPSCQRTVTTAWGWVAGRMVRLIQAHLCEAVG